jgi:hypothetical protein
MSGSERNSFPRLVRIELISIVAVDVELIIGPLVHVYHDVAGRGEDGRAEGHPQRQALLVRAVEGREDLERQLLPELLTAAVLGAPRDEQRPLVVVDVVVPHAHRPVGHGHVGPDGDESRRCGLLDGFVAGDDPGRGREGAEELTDQDKCGEEPHRG